MADNPASALDANVLEAPSCEAFVKGPGARRIFLHIFTLVECYPPDSHSLSTMVGAQVVIDTMFWRLPGKKVATGTGFGTGPCDGFYSPSVPCSGVAFLYNCWNQARKPPNQEKLIN